MKSGISKTDRQIYGTLLWDQVVRRDQKLLTWLSGKNLMDYSGSCENGKCKNVRKGDGIHCHITSYLDSHAMRLWSINDWKIRLTFGITYGFFLGTYIMNWWGDEKESLLTFLGTLFSITSVWVALLVAYWAVEVETSKKRQQKEENDYYRMSLIHDLYGLVMQIKLAYHWDTFRQSDETKRKGLQEQIVKSVKNSEAVIFGWCSDIQMLNLNPHVPAHIKNHVSLIIRTAQKTNLAETGVVEEVFRRINDLLNTDYIKEIKEITVLQWIKDIKRNIA